MLSQKWASGKHEVSNCYDAFFNQHFWICSSAVIALKFLLIPAYSSTDFEVHRNWMALTYQLPLKNWYFEETSKWTLDYPPLFAYFEFLLSKIASYIVPHALVLQAEPYFSYDLLLFQRIGVILSDILYLASCGFLANTISSLTPNSIDRRSSSTVCCILLISNSALIMVDNIHFQYNGLLTALFIFSVSFLLKKRFLIAAFLHCFLLNMKHIYLYYSLGYAVFYGCEYLFKRYKFWQRCFKLSMAMLLPFVVSFGPFLYWNSTFQLSQILLRLFPFKRGLTHAYWAPNLWAIYNFIDLCLYRTLKYVDKSRDLLLPQYTSGLVQEYSHSVLPNISATIALVAIVVLLLPCFLVVSSNGGHKFLLLVTHSAFAFFLAGYHVHEKAVILITISYTILSLLDHRFLNALVVLLTTANISLFPLFFRPFENLIKVSIAVFSHFFSIYVIRAFGLKISLGPVRRLYLILLLVSQAYCLLLHSVIFGNRLDFLPLLITSVSTAFGVIYSFLELLWFGYFA